MNNILIQYSLSPTLMVLFYKHLIVLTTFLMKCNAIGNCI